MMVSNNLGDGAAVSPLDAAIVLTTIEGDEAAIVEAFRSLSHGERCKIGLALSSLASVLYMECKFQPVLLEEAIKIPVTSLEEGVSVQEALFRLGCGFHNGSYPLAKEVSDAPALGGIFVSRKGVITVIGDSKEDLEYVEKHGNPQVSPTLVLAAGSLDDLIRSGNVPCKR